MGCHLVGSRPLRERRPVHGSEVPQQLRRHVRLVEEPVRPLLDPQPAAHEISPPRDMESQPAAMPRVVDRVQELGRLSSAADAVRVEVEEPRARAGRRRPHGVDYRQGRRAHHEARPPPQTSEHGLEIAGLDAAREVRLVVVELEEGARCVLARRGVAERGRSRT